MKNKVRIMRTKPGIKEDEIRSYMDFEKLIHQAEARGKFERILKKTAWVALAGSVIIISWYLIGPNERTSDPITGRDTREEARPQPSRTDSDKSAGQEPEVETTPPLTKPPVKKSPRKEPVLDITTGSEEKIDSARVDTAIQSTPAAYRQAGPVNGYPSLYEYFARELAYPQEALADSVEGIVMVSFTINRQGRPEKITVEQSLGAAFDEESIRVVREMPDWNPAYYGNTPVPSRISVPLTFQIRRLKANDQ